MELISHCKPIKYNLFLMKGYRLYLNSTDKDVKESQKFFHSIRDIVKDGNNKLKSCFKKYNKQDKKTRDSAISVNLSSLKKTKAFCSNI